LVSSHNDSNTTTIYKVLLRGGSHLHCRLTTFKHALALSFHHGYVSYT